MKLVYTEQSIVSLEEALEFIAPHVSYEKLLEIRNRIRQTLYFFNLKKGKKNPY